MNKGDFVFSVKELREYLIHNGYDMSRVEKGLEWQDHEFFLMIPKYYIDLIDWYDSQDSLMKMVMVNNLEKNVYDYEVADPIGDESHSPVPGIVYRYPDRCLLMLTAACAVHCRFCFRKNLLSHNRASYEESMKYIESHPEIWEVILSGGDPFTFTDSFLEKVVTRLRTIPHVKMIRFHTRTPAVYPQRLTESFIKTIEKASPFIVVLHINHPKEITSSFKEKISELKKVGAMLLSQTVLMRDINDDVQTLTVLFKGLVEIGIKPYYLHHLDPAAGTHHFRVSVKRGKDLMQGLRGHISGVCIPEYVIDTPGGYGKIPVFWFQHGKNGEYHATSFEGKKIVYKDMG